MELIRRASQVRTPCRPRGSGLADAFHVTYFPIVDVFRTNATAADGVEKLYPHRKADVIIDVFQLPAMIMSYE